jgi:hypothetical protein
MATSGIVLNFNINSPRPQAYNVQLLNALQFPSHVLWGGSQAATYGANWPT